jgi:hypothetical protein
MGQHALRATPGPVPAAPASARSPSTADPRLTDGSGWRALRRSLASLFLDIGWPACLLAVAAIAGVGLGIALIAPGGLGNSEDASYRFGRYVDLRSDGNAGPYLRQGWSKTSESGRMTIAPWSDMIFSFDFSKKRDLVLTLLAKPVFAAQDDEFWVDVLINGTMAARWSFTRDNAGQTWYSTPVRREDVATLSPMHVTLVIGSANPTAEGSRLEIETIGLRD